MKLLGYEYWRLRSKAVEDSGQVSYSTGRQLVVLEVQKVGGRCLAWSTCGHWSTVCGLVRVRRRMRECVCILCQ